MADKTKKPNLPVLEERFPTPEFFASEVASVAFLHGNLSITFSNPRMSEPTDGRPAIARRAVAGRVVLTGIAANQLVNNIQKLAERMKSAADSKAGSAAESKKGNKS